METKIYNLRSHLKYILIIGLTIIFLTSCEEEHGFPGKAYLALTWYGYEPDYLDAGTTEIPETFYWDEFYRVTPGIYTLYYEISYKSWGVYKTKAFEMDYEIWEEPGEYETIHHPPIDGRNTYFTLELTKNGPGIYEELTYKSAETGTNADENENTDNSGTITKLKDGFGIKIAWKEVEPVHKK